jgi:hypothetical protein
MQTLTPITREVADATAINDPDLGQEPLQIEGDYFDGAAEPDFFGFDDCSEEE